MIKIKQKHYGDLELDTKEKDIVVLWGSLKSEDVRAIMIERERIKELILLLETQLQNDTTKD